MSKAPSGGGGSRSTAERKAYAASRPGGAHPAPGQPDALVPGDDDLLWLYRQTTVSQGLAEALQALVQESADVPMDVVAGTMEAFDKAIIMATKDARSMGCRAKAEAELHVYNNVLERWRLWVTEARMETETSTPAEPDRDVSFDGRLAVTGVDLGKIVQGGHFKRKKTYPPEEKGGPCV